MSFDLAMKLIKTYQSECRSHPKRIPLPPEAFARLALFCKSAIMETSEDYTMHKEYGRPMPSQVNPDFITINTSEGSCEFYIDRPETKLTDAELEEWEKAANNICSESSDYYFAGEIIITIISELKAERKRSEILREALTAAARLWPHALQASLCLEALDRAEKVKP